LLVKVIKLGKADKVPETSFYTSYVKTASLQAVHVKSENENVRALEPIV
jgi:hypothetical protein